MFDIFPIFNRSRLTRRLTLSRLKLGLSCFFLTGILLGYVGTSIVRFGSCGDSDMGRFSRSAGPLRSLIEYASNFGGGGSMKNKNDFVIINIITAEMFLDNRAINVHKTWAQHIPGKVLFMAKHEPDNTTINSFNMPVVRLRGVDDTYPPQKKSFLSMRYAYDTYVNDYEWFIRADDDVYIKGEQLNLFLRDLNSSIPMYIGVPGRGKEDELGILGLKAEDNYCMGGPGMIFSRETIRRVGPNIHQCIKDLYSDHEDVEIGRCIRRFARVNCTWNFEMSDYFYQNYADYKGSYTNKGALEQTHKAITLHPIKDPAHMYRIHNYWLGIKVYDRRDRITHMAADISMCELLITGVDPDPPLARTKDNVAAWVYMDKKRIYDPLAMHPAKGLHLHAFHDAYPVMKDTIFNIENLNRTNGDEMNKKFYNLEQGYMRVNGKYAAQYFMQFLVEAKYATNKLYAATRPIDYRIFVNQPFQAAEIRITDYPGYEEKSIDILEQLAALETPGQQQIILTKTINFIMPLSGRLSTFLRFIGMMEDIGFKCNEDISLTVVQYPHNENDSRAEVNQTMSTLALRYPHYKERLNVITINATFTRGGGLTVGSDSLPSNSSLMYFIDVDIMLTKSTLNRIRSNTIQYRQAYYPVVFSQYDPDAACKKPKCPTDSFKLNRYSGYWRAFGFGIAAMYKSDLNIVGGFDRSIVGWGKEDVDLFEKFVKSNITVFRTIDKGQVHIFHAIICDPSLEASQYRMCFNTKAASYASSYTLSEYVANTKVLMDFDVSAFDFSKMVKSIPAKPTSPSTPPTKSTAPVAKKAPVLANATKSESVNKTGTVAVVATKSSPISVSSSANKTAPQKSVPAPKNGTSAPTVKPLTKPLINDTEVTKPAANVTSVAKSPAVVAKDADNTIKIANPTTNATVTEKSVKSSSETPLQLKTPAAEKTLVLPVPEDAKPGPSNSKSSSPASPASSPILNGPPTITNATASVAPNATSVPLTTAALPPASVTNLAVSEPVSAIEAPTTAARPVIPAPVAVPVAPAPAAAPAAPAPVAAPVTPASAAAPAAPAPADAPAAPAPVAAPVAPAPEAAADTSVPEPDADSVVLAS